MSPRLTDAESRKVGGAGLLAAALQTVAQPVWVVDRDGLIQFANAAAVAALGYSGPGELMGRDSHETIHHHRPDGCPYPAAECPMLRPRTTGQPVTSDLDWFFRRDGSTFRVSYVSAPLEMADGRGAVVAFNDIESRLRADEALREREASLEEQQDALRRVATVVARGLEPEAVFRAVADEVHALLGADLAAIVRFESDGTATAVGAHGGPHPAGARVELDPGYVVASVRDTRQAARFDTDHPSAPAMPEVVRALGIRSGLASPIVVDGELWGAITAGSRDRPLPPVMEGRLAEFTELVAAVIANAQAREDLHRMANEQAALRRVATLVARDVTSDELFGAVAREVGMLFDAEYTGIIRYEPDPTFVTTMATWAAAGEHPAAPTRSRTVPGDPTAIVALTGEPARVDDWMNVPGPIAEFVRGELRVKSSVGTPIVVKGRLWGALAVHSQRGPLPLGTEARLLSFTELVATAIANTDERAEVSRLAQEQAALRRVAELVAREATQTEIFTAIAEEIGQLLGADEMRMMRYESNRDAVIVARAGELESFTVGSRWPLDGDNLAWRIFQTKRPERIDDYPTISGPIGDAVRSAGIRGVVGTPILVHDRLWGAMLTATVSDEPLPPDTESRLGQFTELMATAIANAEARSEVWRLGEEQAALRRVATLVAEGGQPSDVFDMVAAELARLLHADHVVVCRYESGSELTVLAHRGTASREVPPGTRINHEGGSVEALVWRTGRSARLETYDGVPGTIAELARAEGVQVTVGAPVVVDGQLWGVAAAGWNRGEPPPADTEGRMAKFAELLDTAIANADGRDQLAGSRARLVTEADEARRRVVRDLHDGAQQRLVHAIMTLKLARRALRVNDDKTESLISAALEYAQQGNAELRELAHGILPPVLTQGGLRDGIQTVVSRLDLPVEVDVPDRRFPTESEASAYFIVSEALTNVVKHAKAERAEVRAFVEDGVLHVEVRDDGVGGADAGGHGLVGLADRVTALGGRLDVESPVGGGTVLAARLPLPPSAGDDPRGRPPAHPSAPR